MTDANYIRSYNKPVLMGHNMYFGTAGDTGYYVKTTGAAKFASVVAPSGSIATLNSDNVSVSNNLHAAHFDLQTVAQLGGSFYVSPTVKFPNSGTSLTVAKSGTTLTLTITDSSITSTTMAGIVWSANSRVKVSGTINGVVTGTMDGTVSSINTGSHTLTLSVSGENSGSVVAGTYSASQFSDLSVMVYQRRDESNDYRVGIWMNCYDLVNSSSTIRIYGGSSTSPNVMLGNLSNAGLGTVNNLTPEGWGLFAQNAFLHGKVVANGGLIGNWTIGTTGMYYNSDAPGSTSITMIPGGTTASSTSIGGSSGSKQWIFTGKNLFGIDTSGKLYASSAEISGKITATSGTIGGCSITDGVLYVTDANISGTISASHINTSSITIAQSQVTNLTTDLGNKASSSDLTTLSNKVTAVYGTSNPSSTNASTQAKVVTCSNFELYSGALITVKFTYANTYASGAVQLNVNSKGAKNIWVANAVTSSSNKLLWGAGAVITFRYDGTQFVVVGEPRTWFGASTTAAATAAKTDTTAVTGCVVCKGTIVSLSMTYENTATEPTLNIAGTGAIALYAGNSTTRPLTSNGLGWTAGSTTSFVFDGSVWRVGDTAGLAKAYSAQSTANTANTNATNAAKTATNFITADGTNGIKIHKTSNTTDYSQITTDYVQIISDGTHIYKGSNDVACFGDTARIGRIANGIVRTQIDSDSFDVIKRASNTDTVLATFGETATIGNMSTRGVSIDANGFKFNNGGEQNFFIGVNSRSGDTITSATATVTKSSTTKTIDDIVYYRVASIASGQTVISVVGNFQSAVENGEEVMFAAVEDPVKHWTIDSGYLWVEDGYSSYSSFSELITYSYTTSGTSNLPYMVLGTSAYNENNIPGVMSFAQGYKNKATGSFSTALGASTVASGKGAFACGSGTTASDSWSFACGISTVSSGLASHSEGYSTTASGDFSHSEGYATTAIQYYGHSEGFRTTASGWQGHSEGADTTASGNSSHSEGDSTIASGDASHSEGFGTLASGFCGHSDGFSTIASGDYSHTSGYYTVALHSYQFVIGKYNKATVSGSGTEANPYTYTDVGDYPFIIGKGTANTTASRSNAFTVDWSGNVVASGSFKGTGATLTGALSGTSASFSSTLTATSTITGGSFSTTGSVSCASVTATGNVMAANTSHIGMIIMSTTLNTMAKVIAIYGGTTWIQHSGYMLRGATSGVTANSATSNGGAETVTLTVDQIPSHTHPNPSGGAFIINKSVTSGYAMAFGAGSYNRTSASATGSRGGGQAHENMPPYKNVYIWERTA